ncbi:helicase domain protein [Marinomonas mediterranea MMB-1]|uniref:Helicase domain protein n=2 Tax=Marinomonas mediterranea TaxID=119864 RepID=F2K410_MARM1|nr:helicase domain protein [Marinomonas mediterranea MMB-1]
MFNLNPKVCIENVRNDVLSPFMYLKHANKCLSSPSHKSIGREYVIRALDEFDKFESQSQLLKNLVRKAGLYPYLIKFFSSTKAPDIELLLQLYQSEISPDFVFHSMQAKIYNLLISGKNVVLSAPTSMGKSAIVDSLIASNRFNRLVVVVPTIALIDETRRRIQKNFGRKFQVIHHGSQERRKDRTIYVLTQERVNEREDLQNIDLFVVDEFYKLAFSHEDKSRAISLNIALSKLLSVSKQFYMIGPYIDAMRGMDALQKEYVFVPSDFNTVALNVNEYNIKPNDVASKNSQLKKILETYKGQTIIYCRSQKSIDQVVTSMDYICFDKPSREIKNYYRWLKRFYGSNWCYSRALKLGIGVHHGALPRALQQKTVDLFNKNKIKYLVCTSTLIEGVNTVAENVVIYDNRRANASIDDFTHKNIAGRAGRMNQHLIGNVFCLESLPSREFQSNVVELPLGHQNVETPLNLLAGIQSEHLTDMSRESLSQFDMSSKVPLDLIRKHASYNVLSIESAYSFITELSIEDMKLLSKKKTPDSYNLELLVQFIKILEAGALQKLSLHFEDNDELKNRMAWYIYAESHTDYIRERLKYIYSHREGVQRVSEGTDWEFKIARNIFKHSIPRALMLLQDLLNYQFDQLDIKVVTDFGYLVHIFENSHLPTAFSALEEMGIAIETLEKLVTERVSSSSIETLSRYIRMYYKKSERLHAIDRMFIRLAL